MPYEKTDIRDLVTIGWKGHSHPEYFTSDDYLHLGHGFESMERFEEALNTAGIIGTDMEHAALPLWPAQHAGFALNDNIYVQPFAAGALAEKYYPIHIYIQTENAFGDGSHPTTRICMSFLYEYVKNLRADEIAHLRVIDVGTGTGVLSILAAHLGIRFIDAIELHEKAVKTARENFNLNNCGWINAFQADISCCIPGNTYTIVMANMVSDVIIPNLGSISRLAAAQGILIISGISDARALSAEDEFLREHLSIIDHLQEDGWNGYLLKAAPE